MTGPGAIWVFAGPSLPPGQRPESAALHWRPPAVAGDGLAALEAGAGSVVLIDGFFDRYPAIRHKELLALIERGVRVIGGASMGALRAAELHGHGMEGAGAIFQAYAAGRLVRDDEVALLHGPAEMEWAALTVPLVNARATLQRAARDRILSLDTARRLRQRASDIFFQDRTWRVLIDAAAAAGELSGPELDRFQRWIPGGYVDLKRRDARLCLAAAVADRPATDARPAPQGATTFTAALAAQLAGGLKPDPASPARRP